MSRGNLLALSALALSLTAPACFLAPPSPPNTWQSEVEPTLICPGDEVTVTWNAGPWSGCRRNAAGEFVGGPANCGHPTRIAVRSTPDVFTADPIDPRETAGSRTIRPVENTSISFTASGRNDTVGPLNHVVSVMTEANIDSGWFYGICDGRRPSWQQLDLDKSWIPETAELIELCNPNDFRVTVSVATDGGIRTFDLGAAGDESACTGALDGVVRQVSGSTRSATVTAGSGCSGVLAVPPRPFRVLETWSCS
ncbi:MAG: hypothetical protein AAF604_03035 [Acidobacteriota bacterium]